MNLGNEIKLVVTDFDGTLVDTFAANLAAYQEAFKQCGLVLDQNIYKRCFGYRFECFIQEVGIADSEMASRIRQKKASLYPAYFNLLKVNLPLLNFLKVFRLSGGKTAIASTARRENLMNVLRYLGLCQEFDYILTGESVAEGKPSPEIYQKVLEHFSLPPSEALVFEDSNIGMKASQRAGINYVRVNSDFYGDRG